MIDYRDVEPRLYGLWPDFISRMTGYEIPHFKGKGHPCPRCGGSDRAHWREKDGRAVLFCRGACGKSDSSYGSNTMTTPEDFIIDQLGIQFVELVRMAADYVGYQHSGGQSRPVKRSQMRPDIQKALASAKRVDPVESYMAMRFCYMYEDIYLIDDIESIPLINKRNGEVDGFLQVTRTGAQRVVLSTDKKALHCTIGQKSDKKIFCTDFVRGSILNRIYGWQVVYSPSASFYKNDEYDGVLIKNSDYETLLSACYAYQPCDFYYPEDADTFEFTKKLKRITSEKAAQKLTDIEMRCP